MALSGLASGFDWKSIVDQLIEVSRAPQNRMVREKSALASKSAAINDLKGLVSTFKSSLTTMVSDDALFKKSATFKDSTTNWSASATKDTPAGDYKFNLLTTATTSKLTGAGDLVADIDTSAAISDISVGRALKAGYFTVNGEKITIATTDSLDDIFGKILGQTGVVASYSGDQIRLSSGASISLGASNDTSNFLQAMRLSGSGVLSGGSYEVATSAPGLSAPRLNVALNSSNLAGLTPVTAGVEETLIINGESIAYQSTDTIQDILNSINSSNAGVSAIYDLAAGQFSLTSKVTGNVGITVSDTGTGTLGAAMGLVGQAASLGADATFTINGGGTLSSRSNTLDETAHGIVGLTATANSVGEQTLTVAGDYTSAKESLNDFISKYNAVQNAIEKYTKVTVSGDKVSTAVLAGNRELSSLSRSLRTALYTAGTGISGGVQRLSDLGINFSGIEPTISLTNSTNLETKLAMAADDISEYFSTAGTGLLDRLDTLLSGYVSETGLASGGFKAQLDSITSQNKSLDKQIEDVERRLASQRSLLESSFIAMERAQSNFQQQSSYLAKTFNNSK